MTQSEFLELADAYEDSCTVIGGDVLESLICSLLKLLQALNLTIITDIASSLGIDLSPVLNIVQQALGTVNQALGGLGLDGIIGGATGVLGGKGGFLGGLGGILGGGSPLAGIFGGL